MPRFRFAPRVRAALVGATLLSACYRVTVVSNAAPSPTVLDKPWVNSFVFGLVPPDTLRVTPTCAGGNVSKVVTERSFLNGLVAAITWNIYTPLHVNVTCGSGSRSSMGLPPELLGRPATHAVATDATR
jgi:Bor protein